MAIYHFHAQVISRSTGRSAVACAAYRSGERLHDERYDKDHDYTKKEGVVHEEILLPENAPAWMSDREQLWNAVEAHEKRKDAQLAREFNVSLPRELTRDQNLDLIREFVKTNCVEKGMVADVCVHDEVATDGHAQLHAHVMLTMRHLDGEGFGPKARDWNDKSTLLEWREAWAEVANRQLSLNGHDRRIDHRTLEAQGIPLEPQHRIGANSVRDQLAAMADHERIARENGERLLKEPEIVLDALSRQQSTFTPHDIARTINRYTVDAEQFQTVHAKVLASDELMLLGQDDKGRDRYTTRSLFELEKKMMHQVEELSMRKTHTVTVKRVEQAISKSTLSEQQQAVLKHLLWAGDARCVIGYAGTGKSTMLKVAREVWEGEGYHVRGMTLSGIAAQNLEHSSGIKSRTIASWCYRWDQGKDKLTSRDVLIIDEAGMVGSRQFARLVDEVHKAGAKVILTGDTWQFQAIEAGAAFRAATERVPTMELTEVWRQKEEWQREATKEFAQGRAQDALARYEEKGCIHGYRTQDEARHALLARWDQVRFDHPTRTQIVLTYTRAETKNLNELLRAARQQGGELGPDHVIHTERGARHFAVQDRIYFLKNDTSLNVKNGTLGTITAIRGDALTVRLDPEPESKNASAREVHLNLKEYNQLDHGYAATLHKGQGVTADYGHVFGSKLMDAHGGYVGFTRHRDTLNFFWSREEFSDRDDLIRTLSRERQKDVSLDYSGQEKLPFAQAIERRHQMGMSDALKLDQDDSSPIDDYERYQQAKARLDEYVALRESTRSFKGEVNVSDPARAPVIVDHDRFVHKQGADVTHRDASQSREHRVAEVARGYHKPGKIHPEPSARYTMVGLSTHPEGVYTVLEHLDHITLVPYKIGHEYLLHKDVLVSSRGDAFTLEPVRSVEFGGREGAQGRSVSDEREQLLASLSRDLRKIGQASPDPSLPYTMAGTTTRGGQEYTVLSRPYYVTVVPYQAGHEQWLKREVYVNGHDLSRHPDPVIAWDQNFVPRSAVFDREVATLAQNRKKPVQVIPEPNERYRVEGLVRLDERRYTLLENYHHASLVPYQKEHVHLLRQDVRALKQSKGFILEPVRLLSRDIEPQHGRSLYSNKGHIQASLDEAVMEFGTKFKHNAVRSSPDPHAQYKVAGTITLNNERYTLLEHPHHFSIVRHQSGHDHLLRKEVRISGRGDAMSLEPTQPLSPSRDRGFDLGR